MVPDIPVIHLGSWVMVRGITPQPTHPIRLQTLSSWLDASSAIEVGGHWRAKWFRIRIWCLHNFTNNHSWLCLLLGGPIWLGVVSYEPARTKQRAGTVGVW